MPGLVDRIAQLRHPLTYVVDIVGGMRALGLRGTRRVVVSNVVMGVVVGSGVGAVGGAAVEALGVIEPQVSQAVTSQAALEYAGLTVGLSAAGGLVQGIHQVSKEGQAAREARAASRRDPSARRSQWLL